MRLQSRRIGPPASTSTTPATAPKQGRRPIWGANAPRSAVGTGSRHASVATYIPYIRGAALEHVVSVLAPRGSEHHQILDSFEGVPAAESTIATQLGEITGQVAEQKAVEGWAATAARLRVAASVFGS